MDDEAKLQRLVTFIEGVIAEMQDRDNLNEDDQWLLDRAREFATELRELGARLPGGREHRENRAFLVGIEPRLVFDVGAVELIQALAEQSDPKA